MKKTATKLAKAKKLADEKGTYGENKNKKAVHFAIDRNKIRRSLNFSSSEDITTQRHDREQ